MKKKKRFSVGMALIYIGITLLAFLCLYPFLNMLAYSLSGNDAILSGTVTFLPKDINFAAYKQILGKKQIWQAMSTTVKVTLWGTATGVVLTSFAAYALSRQDLPGRSVITGFILFTMYFGGGTIPTFLVVKQLGLYDTMAALVLPSAINVFNFIVMRTFFRQLPQSLEEAARIDGAGVIQIFFKIIIPLSVPIFATMALFYAVQYWNSYFDALLYIQSSERYTLQLRLRSLLFEGGLNSSAVMEGSGTPVMAESLKMASVMVSTLPILVVYPWLQKYFVKGVMIGSVKG